MSYTGQTLGAYRVLEQIGQGGMATVFKAYQASMDRYVAIKILPSHLTQDATFAARFNQEARTLARLEHPHILPVYDYGEQEGTAYLVMRYIDAGTLQDHLIQRGPLDLPTTARIIGQVGRALGYAHTQGIIHRDIKPSNVLLDNNGNAFLTDFGIAKLIAGIAQFTGTGTIIGTPTYMSPEQGLGKPLDHRTDIYSLGVMLYKMVTGDVPFDAETPLAVLMMHVNEPLPLPRQRNPHVPEPVERIILKALAKTPEERYSSAVELAQALERVTTAPLTDIPTVATQSVTPAHLSHEIESTPTVVTPTKSAALARRRIPWLPLGGCVTLLVLFIIAALLIVPRLLRAIPTTTPTPVPSMDNTVLLIDNLDPECRIEAGVWESGDAEDAYGRDFYYAEPGCLACQMRCTLTVPEAGNYTLWAWWPRGDDRATDTPHTIERAGVAPVTFEINQRDRGSAWYRITDLELTAGERFNLVIGGAATGYANTDALTLTQADAGPPE